MIGLRLVFEVINNTKSDSVSISSVEIQLLQVNVRQSLWFLWSSISALRWLGWGRHRAAALPAPPSLSGSRPLCIHPRSTPTDQRTGNSEKNIEKKNQQQQTYITYIVLFCFSPSFPSRCELSSHLLSQRCFYCHWNPHIPLQTYP